MKLAETVDDDRFLDSWHSAMEAHPILRTRIVPVATYSARSLQIVVKSEAEAEARQSPCRSVVDFRHMVEVDFPITLQTGRRGLFPRTHSEAEAGTL